MKILVSYAGAKFKCHALLLKSPRGFEPKISKLGILTQLEAGSCAKLVFFRFVAVKPLVRLLAVSFHCPFACGYSPLQSACG